MTIKSISDDQTEIIANIMKLCSLERFDVDMTYGNGSFWETLGKPMLSFDIDPQFDHVLSGDSRNLQLPDNFYASAIFDPPFLTYIKNAREHDSIMAKRFGGYWTYGELQEHYQGTIKEANRILRKKGIFVVKCQDIIHNHKIHATHVNIINWSSGLFRLKDLFILTAKHRVPILNKIGNKEKVQKHARVYHSYFLVMEKM